jgi:hypothetical protein
MTRSVLAANVRARHASGQIAEEGQAERDAREQKRVDRLMQRGIRELREP